MQAPPRPPFRSACSGQACRLSHGSCFKTVSAPSFPCPPKSEHCHKTPPENVARPCRRAVLRADAFRVRKTSPKPGGTPISIAVLRRKTSRRQAPASPANRRVRLRPARTLPAERRASAAPVPKKAPAADLQSAQTSEPHGYSKHAERGCPFRDIPFRYSVSARRPDKPHFPQVPLRQPAARTLGSDGSFPKETGTIPGISDGPREYGKWRG